MNAYRISHWGLFPFDNTERMENVIIDTVENVVMKMDDEASLSVFAPWINYLRPFNR